MSVLPVANAKARYEALQSDRESYLVRARANARLTIPSVMPPGGHNGHSNLDTPNQSLGARGLRHLASKLLITQFPSTAPFFKYSVDDISIQKLTEDQALRGEVEEALNVRERAVMSEVDAAAFRPTAFEAFRQLLCAGNYLLHLPQDHKEKVRGFRLDKYAASRDPAGTLLELVVAEEVAKGALDPEVRMLLAETDGPQKEEKDAETVTVYTHVKLEKGGRRYTEYQEVGGHLIPDTDGHYPPHKLPWLPLRLNHIDGEHYGRSYVEEFMGDLLSLDILHKAVREATAVGAKVIFLVRPGMGANVKKLAKAESGDFVVFEHEAVQALQVDKRIDLQTAFQMIGRLEENLQFAFLLHTAIQRSGERVTAEEIRYMASEIEDGLGGIYSLLSLEFQLPIVHLFEARMEKRRKVPPLPGGAVKPTIVTGLDALGRGHDLQNLDALIGGLLETVGPEAVQTYLNLGEFIKRRGASLGVDMKGLIRTDEEIEQEREQQRMQQMMQHLGPEALSQAGGMMRDGMQPPPQPEEG